MPETAIIAENVTFSFGQVHAVVNLSLEIPRGIIFGFLGPNGAGKTTTIHLLLGLLSPKQGRVIVLGHDTKTNASILREKTGALLEHHGLYERLSAEDNLDFYGRIWQMPYLSRKARIKELLTKLGLWENRRQTVAKWSRGMKQKLALARALLHHPPLIFLDEPTAGLDPLAAAALRDELISLVVEEGVTVFLTTHNLAEAEKLCNLVGVIRTGELVAFGPPNQLISEPSRVEIVGENLKPELLSALCKHPNVAYVKLENNHLFIDLAKDAKISPLVSLLVHAGVGIEEVRKNKASLEDTFLQLMEEEK